MGYESKLYIVNKSRCLEIDCPRFCFQIAQYDLDYYPPIADLFREDNPESKYTDCGLYLDGDGDNQVIEDKYGDKLREASLKAVINVLKNTEDDPYKGYQRLPPLLAMLESFYEMRDIFKDLVVIHFGH
jgi:hypothetical protein